MLRKAPIVKNKAIAFKPLTLGLVSVLKPIMVDSPTAPNPEVKILELLDSQTTFEQGFHLLVQHYKERLYWHIRRMVTHHADSDDVLQNTFIKVYKGLPKFKRQSKLYTWLYRIATNEALTFLKKRRHSYSIHDEDLALSRKLKADEYFEGDRAQRILQEALSILPDKQRLVFNMRYFEEMPYKDISAIVDTSVGALKASYHHAVKKIEAYVRDNAR